MTGATSVSKLGEKFSYQMSIYDDRFIPGLTELAKLIKRNGSKALVQIYHAGANSKVSYEKHGMAVGPSAVDFPYLPYEITELMDKGVWEIIDDFGEATKRVIKAGFDGVEIHGAYSHILQQFFSSYSNKRNDYWGGTLQKRMNFALEVIKRIQEVAKEYAKDDFIMGYRLTQEEIHEHSVGYNIQDTLQFVDRLADTNMDYIHVTSSDYGKQIKEVIHRRTAFIFVLHVFNVQDAVDGLQYGEMISMSRQSLIEPDFAKKIKEGREEDVATEITSPEMAKSIAFPPKMVDWLLDPKGKNPVPKGMGYFKELV
ncbi:NADH-dependent flavin oxidoreductase [Priestia endophytica]|uniref:oxidoreductase n=1 Tax=Priestia endophytica TaxID=135735 RepID=UPI002E22416F|nr:NADH-dependent flavin oxidoreductase [Priestia endophytica]